MNSLFKPILHLVGWNYISLNLISAIDMPQLSVPDLYYVFAIKVGKSILVDLDYHAIKIIITRNVHSLSHICNPITVINFYKNPFRYLTPIIVDEITSVNSKRVGCALKHSDDRVGDA